MLKVFPDDRVRVCIQPDRNDKPVAEVLKLLDSSITDFNGRCVTKGKAVFVEPDLPRLTRWLFVPPHARNGMREGDYVRASIMRHPIRDGKPQAKVLKIFGDQDYPGVECDYVITKYGFNKPLPSAAQSELDAILAAAPGQPGGDRRDLSDLPFVTIDSARTLDIDDALFAEATDKGWNLYVAIADPTDLITSGSELDNALLERAVSLYLPGDVVPMIPAELTHGVCALAEGELRPALVSRIAVTDDGGIEGYEFFEALVQSAAKLSYVAVDRYVTGSSDDLMSHASPLEALYQVFRALRAHREVHELVMEDRTDYRMSLGEDRKIESIETQEKLQSQKLVEECMIAANRCAADFLATHKCPGPFVTHRGFREDRLKQARKLLKEHLPDCAGLSIETLEGYRDLLKHLQQPDLQLPFRSIINRLLARAEISEQVNLHMGMCLPVYTNATSPLRKYTDFLVHRRIKSVLRSESTDEHQPGAAAHLLERIGASRDASKEVDSWLKCHYAQGLLDQEFQATICHINSSGFTARIMDNGIEGQIDLRKHPSKFSFDTLTATLRSPEQVFQLEQILSVRVVGVNVGTREIKLKMVDQTA